MNPLKILSTPEYLFRPSQILVRLKRSLVKPASETAPVRLPWGATILVRPAEVIGANIWFYGLFDLIVAEAIARLADPGEHALDIGANIGQMTTLLSVLSGPQGRVDAFEPHPGVFKELQGNIKLCGSQGHDSPVHLHQLALSNQNAQGHLTLPELWNGNRGIGRVDALTPPAAARQIAVPLQRLDALLPSDAKVGLCKVDVEGHELQMFEGAETLLREERIRDIVFEDLDPYPSAVHSLLMDRGYTLFALWSRTLRPVFQPVSDQTHIPTTRDGLNYVATLDPDRARTRFQPGGWKVFKVRP